MASLHALIDLLTRDVAVWGGLRSPLLSWLGSGALGVFFVWQLARLLIGVARARQPFLRLRPTLVAQARRVESADLDEAYARALTGRAAPPTREDGAGGAALTVHQLKELDAAMRAVDVFRRPWIQFRKSLLLERVPWFKEPRVFSTRRAEEFFGPELIFGPRVDLAFFAQVPSLITGLGLLLTFVAICVGLSRLHAEGQAITGIEGLINGLAGKFLTSIVGLVCANLFLLLERPAVRHLLAAHGEFVALLDESFPRRTVEELLDGLGQRRILGDGGGRARGPARQWAEERSELDAQHLGASIDALADVVRALAERLETPREGKPSLVAVGPGGRASAAR